jgi:hypothetical protein
VVQDFIKLPEQILWYRYADPGEIVIREHAVHVM